MKILLDENLPHELRRHLSGHDVYTVTYLQWSGTKNGELLRRAAAESFDVLLTMDSGVQYQQNPATLPLSIVIIRAASNDIDDLVSVVPLILQSLKQVQPKTILRLP